MIKNRTIRPAKILRGYIHGELATLFVEKFPNVGGALDTPTADALFPLLFALLLLICEGELFPNGIRLLNELFLELFFGVIFVNILFAALVAALTAPVAAATTALAAPAAAFAIAATAPETGLAFGGGGGAPAPAFISTDT